MLLRKTYSINACISKEESSTFGEKKANETESKQKEENTKYGEYEMRNQWKPKQSLLGFVCVFRKINKSDKLLSGPVKEKK